MKVNYYGLEIYLEFFIRDKGENYYIDQVIDFIIFETMDAERSLGLLSISGYKAGEDRVYLS